MKKKKSIIVNSVIAATVATSVFAVSNPANAASTSKAEQAVVKAEKLGGTLKWEISIEYRKTKYPNSLVGLPNMKLFNDTKKALADAKKAVSGLKGKEKDVLSARLDANVALHVNRAVAYIDAVSSGLKIQKKSSELDSYLANGTVNDQTEKLYHELTREIKKNAFMLDRVYGVTTREEFRSFYKKTAEAKVSTLVYPVTIKMELDRANAALKASNFDEAAARLGNVSYFVKDAAVKKGQKASDKLIVGSLANQKAIQDNFNTKAALYVADSTDAKAPTVFGPATGSETIGKTVYVYVGLNEQLKLQNVSVDGNLVILGSPAGGGSVYLENVKVNKGTTANFGKIIVENVADHSLHMKGVQADSVVVNDADGSNIVAEAGTKINSLVISEKAGTSGKTTLESQEKGSIESITIASKGNDKSQGTELKGNFSTTNVTVTGAGSKIELAPGSEVNHIDFKAAAQLTVPAGATVNQLTKDPSVPGDVKVDNKGTVKESNNNINVGGNPPVVVTQPGTTNPAPNPGTGGENPPPVVDTTPVISSFAVSTVSKQQISGSYNKTNSTGSVDLSKLDKSEEIESVKIVTTNVSKLTISSLTATDNGKDTVIPLSTALTYTVTNNTVTISSKDLGLGAVSMDTLRQFIGQKMTLTGKLYDLKGNPTTSDVKIVITLGGTSVTTATYSNDYGTVTKTGTNVAVLVKNKDQVEGVVIANSEKGKELLKLAANIENFDVFTGIISAKLGKAWNEVTVGDLVTGKTYNVLGFDISFNWA